MSRLRELADALRARLSPTYLIAPWALMDRLRTSVLRLNSRANLQDARIERMESRMATFEQAAADLAALTDDMANKLDAAEAANAELRLAVANGDTSRLEALANQAAQHTAVIQEITARLRGVGADASNPIPDVSPLPEPDPTAVAGNPTTGEVVDELPAPETTAPAPSGPDEVTPGETSPTES